MLGINVILCYADATDVGRFDRDNCVNSRRFDLQIEESYVQTTELISPDTHHLRVATLKVF